MNLSIRSYQSGDDEEIVNLLVEVFNGWPKFDLQCSPLDHWRWKFCDNPLNVKVIALATSNDKIIGCFHDLMQRVKIGEDLFLSANGVDVANHKDYRGIGLYSKIRAHILELERAAGVKLHYGIDSNPILIKRARKMNSSFPFSLESMMRICDIDLHLKMSSSENAFIRKYGFYILKAINKFRIPVENSDESKRNFNVSEIRRFDEKIDPFLDSVRKHYKFMVARDKVYLNWRYCDLRGGKYLLKIAIDQDQILGYIVLRINKYQEEYPVGYIVDLLALPNHLNVASELVKDGISYLENENVNIVRVHILKNSLFESILRRVGFIDDMTKPYLNYSQDIKNSAIDELNKSNAKNKHFVFGDCDHI